MPRFLPSWLSPSDDKPFGVAGAVPSSLRRADPTTGVDDIVLGADDDTLSVTADVVNPGDSFDGGDGSDTLVLTGGGVFDLSAVTLAQFEALETDGSDSSVVFADLGQAVLLLGGVGLTGADDVVTIAEAEFVDLVDVAALFDLGAEAVHLVTPFIFDPGPFDFTFTPGPDEQINFAGVDVSVGNTSEFATIDGYVDDNFNFREIVATTDSGVVATYGFDERGRVELFRVEDGPADEFRYLSRTLTYDGVRLDTRTVEFESGVTVTTDYFRDQPQLVTRAAADGSLTIFVAGRQGDTLTGSTFDDRLRGGNGADLLLGDAGDDRIAGGRGGDLFDLSGGGRDVVSDFDVATDSLHIDGVGGLADLTVRAGAAALRLETAAGDIVRLVGLDADDAALIVFA